MIIILAKNIKIINRNNIEIFNIKITEIISNIFIQSE